MVLASTSPLCKTNLSALLLFLSFKTSLLGTSLAVQWLRLGAPNAGVRELLIDLTCCKKNKLRKRTHLFSPAFTHPNSVIYSSITYLIYALAYSPVNHGFPVYQLCLSFPICEMGVIITPTSKDCGDIVPGV